MQWNHSNFLPCLFISGEQPAKQRSNSNSNNFKLVAASECEKRCMGEQPPSVVEEEDIGGAVKLREALLTYLNKKNNAATEEGYRWFILCSHACTQKRIKEERKREESCFHLRSYPGDFHNGRQRARYRPMTTYLSTG